MANSKLIVVFISWLLISCTDTSAPIQSEPSAGLKVQLPSEVLGKSAKWQSLFSGHSLDGWVPKFTKSTVGKNVLETFRAANGILSVDYSNWDELDGRFGHLFTEGVYSHYILRLEYRFVGEQLEAGAFMGWAKRNNGAMLHSQSAASMDLDQQFPVSIEGQLLGGLVDDPRHTGNLCTPGTHVVMRGELIKEHCIPSSLPALEGDQWVKAEFEVLGSERIRHFINGELALEYSQPQYDPSSPEAENLRGGASILLSQGHIALQAESHPTEFRNIEIHILKATNER